MALPLRNVIRRWMVRGAETLGDQFVVESIPEMLGTSPPVTVDEARGLPGIGRAVRLSAGVASQVPIYAVRGADDLTRIAQRVSPTPQILRDPDPNGANPGPGWRWAVVEALQWYGNVWARQTDHTPDGWPRRLPLFQTQNVTWNQDTARWEIGDLALRPSEVLHLKTGAPAGERMGRGILANYQEELKLIRAAERAQYVLLDHGVPTGLLSIDKDAAIGPNEAPDIKRKWHESQRKRSVAVLKAITYQRVGFNAEELTMIPTREFNLRLASDITGMPPYLLGVPSESRVYANAETEWTNYVRTSLGQFLSAIEYGMSNCLPSKGTWDQQARFDLSVLMRGDAKTRWDVYKIAADLEAMSVEEIRNAESMGPQILTDGGHQDQEQPADTPPGPEEEQ